MPSVWSRVTPIFARQRTIQSISSFGRSRSMTDVMRKPSSRTMALATSMLPMWALVKMMPRP